MAFVPSRTSPRGVRSAPSSSPLNVISPASMGSSRLRQRIRVLLPEPDEPTRTATSPWFRSTSTACSAVKSPNLLTTERAVSTGSAGLRCSAGIVETFPEALFQLPLPQQRDAGQRQVPDDSDGQQRDGQEID